MSRATPAHALSQLGTSIWLDDLSRKRIESGNLAELISECAVVGVTTNPTIFAQALSSDLSYAADLKAARERSLSPEETVIQLTCTDVMHACDLLIPTYEATDGVDGRVSIEVSPLLANDVDATVAEARSLWHRVNRPNLLVKVPATEAGLGAISMLLSEGISVNVTLIFSLQRYREVINAYLTGLERARANGIDLSTLHSVASFFVSRVDTAIDAQLRADGSPEALSLVGKTGIANARLAYQVFRELFSSERAMFLQKLGARVQRPLWASTGVKDPTLPDTLYVTELAGPRTVNTMPEATLTALLRSTSVTGDQLTHTALSASQTMNEVAHLGIDFNEVVERLEREGIEKFVTSWNELLTTVAGELSTS